MTEDTFKNRWIKNKAILSIKTGFCLFCLLSLFQKSFAQADSSYEEIAVFMNVPGIGSEDIQAVINNDTAYLAITDIFEFLKIKNNPSLGLDSISGFFLNQQTGFLVDKIHNRITFRGKTFDLGTGDLIRTMNNLYLRTDYFEKIFGLKCTFNFRSL